jgi:hypothetical protein
MKNLLLLGHHPHVLRVGDGCLLVFKGEFLRGKLYTIIEKLMKLSPSESRGDERFPHREIFSCEFLRNWLEGGCHRHGQTRRVK